MQKQTLGEVLGVIACMGGWCVKRDKCPHYGAQSREPVERLCLPGQDGRRLVDVTPFRRVTVDVMTGREESAIVENIE